MHPMSSGKILPPHMEPACGLNKAVHAHPSFQLWYHHQQIHSQIQVHLSSLVIGDSRSTQRTANISTSTTELLHVHPALAFGLLHQMIVLRLLKIQLLAHRLRTNPFTLLLFTVITPFGN
jgi:hypothetical protein